MKLFSRPIALSLQILLGLGVALMAGLLTIGALAFLSAEDEIVETYDSQLITSASVLWSLTRDETSRSRSVIDDQKLPLDASDAKVLKKYAKWRSFRIWENGQLLRATKNAPLPDSAPFAKGFNTITINKTKWRIYTLYVPEDHLVIEVGEMLAARERLISKIVRDLLVPLLVALPLLLILAWLAIHFGLRDLYRLTSAIKSRSARDLSPLDIGGTPKELKPLGDALNSLMAALERSLHQERLFTDNAAHELRTPIAALKMQAEVIANARDTKAVHGGIVQLQMGIERAARLLDQLLTLARLEHIKPAHDALNLYHYSQTAIIDLYPKALAKQITLGLSGDETTMIAAHPTLVSLLLNNLLDNAIKYAPSGSEIELEIMSDGFCLTDQGPGIAPEEREKVFGRFYRIGVSTQNGSGLGLSIVRTICDMLHLGIHLEDAEGSQESRAMGSKDMGLRVKVVFKKN